VAGAGGHAEVPLTCCMVTSSSTCSDMCFLMVWYAADTSDMLHGDEQLQEYLEVC
jgi:hypothetical protein